MILSKQDVLNIIGKEKLRLELSLIFAKGDIKKASEIVSMSERNFYRKLKQYDLSTNMSKNGLSKIT